MAEDRIETRHPTPGLRGTRICAAKYEAVKTALLSIIPVDADGVAFKGLPARVKDVLPADFDGSVSWYTTTVKLDLEARGLIERVPKVTPQRLRRQV